MATKAKSTKAAAPTVAPAATTAPANPFAALVAGPTAPAAGVTATVAKVHALAIGNKTLKAANHVATFKGTKQVAVGGVSYTLTGTAYAPQAGHVNAVQWQAVQAAMAANGGQATVAQIAQCFAAAGLPAGLATGFVVYRAKGAKPNLKQVA